MSPPDQIFFNSSDLINDLRCRYSRRSVFAKKIASKLGVETSHGAVSSKAARLSDANMVTFLDVNYGGEGRGVPC